MEGCGRFRQFSYIEMDRISSDEKARPVDKICLIVKPYGVVRIICYRYVRVRYPFNDKLLYTVQLFWQRACIFCTCVSDGCV